MLEEEGIVVSVSEGMAEVRVTPQSACGGCSASSGCGTSLIASLFPQRATRFQVKNTLGAKTGEQVVIGLPESVLQSASLIFYLIPVLGLILGAIIGIYLSEALYGRPSEGLSILLGIGGLAGGFVMIQYLGQHSVALNRYKAEIIRIKKTEILFSPK